MDFEPQPTAQTEPKKVDFAQPLTTRKSLELLRDTEALLRRPTVATLVPILPPKLAKNVEVASSIADEYLQQIAQIDLENINDDEMRSPRIWVGLSFVGFGALMIVVLLLYLNTLHPEFNTVQQIGKYWYQYIWFVCLGVAGMFILGREAMRPMKTNENQVDRNISKRAKAK
ncbi:MAG: hypothetical protein SAK29_15050 [Scytonema sp. PMC 1069.18]|nr:hypothetical protein [Scytonema sp. PMC 1069.18]MEC4887192.1 hypothetical protein [Scytonema sp. PMC 1070.18]